MKAYIEILLFAEVEAVDSAVKLCLKNLNLENCEVSFQRYYGEFVEVLMSFSLSAPENCSTPWSQIIKLLLHACISFLSKDGISIESINLKLSKVSVLSESPQKR